MGAAVLLLWAGRLWTIVREVCRLLWAVSPLRRALTLAVLFLALTCCRSPEEMRKNHQ